MNIKKMLIIGGIVVLILVGYWAWQNFNKVDTDGFIKGNGRIEATEVNIASKMAGQLENINVNEGDFVKSGQLLATIKVLSLEAQLREAKAQLEQAKNAVLTANAQVNMRLSDKIAAEAQVQQQQTSLRAAERRLSRTEILAKDGATSKQQLDDERADADRARAAVSVAKAQVASAQEAIVASHAQVTSAKSNVEAAQATVERIQFDIEDSQLKSPINGRVQYRVAQPGEMIAAGGKVLNLIDLSDVYMTFFLPETVAGKVALGTEVRLVLDVAPDIVIPAKVSYVADTAQFTPKTVETESERQKLMFKVKAKIDPDLLNKYITQVKTGLPGVAWIRLDNSKSWPKELSRQVK
ncbi:HlyD family secretion protein [Acinetobacter stercoris]|uniref:Multidrug export protein EmrA n=1 Tax=Acinetobacter stercoris TaxID=2126983 RepID=A0A2U3N331_9GAMM|nr:HlyD family efflux transporter periplasmic adaptor subunit [Acinetobacter stercoris]SPL72100.1 Multidrug export protein EmrA [Acinetobacter stercoris]